VTLKGGYKDAKGVVFVLVFYRSVFILKLVLDSAATARAARSGADAVCLPRQKVLAHADACRLSRVRLCAGAKGGCRGDG
jgi:hypothetical protein